MDDDGSQSNGSGKSSLVMAPLWALTGRSDARAEVNFCCYTFLGHVKVSVHTHLYLVHGHVTGSFGKGSTVSRPLHREYSKMAEIIDWTALHACAGRLLAGPD